VDEVEAAIEHAVTVGASDRKLRLFGCACVRQAWHLLDDPRWRDAVETSERYADGEARAEELATAQSATRSACPPDAVTRAEGMALAVARGVFALTQTGENRAWYATVAATESVFLLVADTYNHASTPPTAYIVRKTARRVRVALLACIVGPRPLPAVNPAWLALGDGTVARLARAAYDDRNLPDGTLDPALLAALADALEDAGCTDADLLGHLRSPGPHVRGCWAVDLVLGKS
jgi:hypothetical protein